MTAMSSVERTERATERRRDEVDRVAARVECTRQAEETVDHPVEASMVDLDTCLAQAPRVSLAFVSERVVLGGDHDCGCDAVEIGSPQRRDRPRGRVRAAIRVAIEEPLHL